MAPSGVSFPLPRTRRPVSARVTVQRPELAATVELSDVSVTYPHLQTLPGERILLVGARCRWRVSGPDRNAVVYGADGAPVMEAVLGDGIEHVLTDAAGRVWVGYFDEGVYGNLGWGEPENEPPVGQRGLVRYSPELRREWEFPADAPAGPIDDCYALNVTGGDAWLCYYSDFPIVRVADDAVTSWRSQATFVRGLMVSSDRIACYGGDPGQLVTGRLTGDRWEPTGTYRLVLRDGAPPPAGTTVVGRGSELHLFVGADWYRLRLEALPAGR